MFRATMCPSSGENTVPMQHLVFVTLYRWLSGMHPVPTRQSSIQSDKYQVSRRYDIFSWWWAHSHPKHVENRNKHTKKNCAPSQLYLQDYTGMHGQQNIKFGYLLLVLIAQVVTFPTLVVIPYSEAMSECCIWLPYLSEPYTRTERKAESSVQSGGTKYQLVCHGVKCDCVLYCPVK